MSIKIKEIKSNNTFCPYCECESNRYYTRKYVNNFGMKVEKYFFKCVSCHTKYDECYIPTIDDIESTPIEEIKEDDYVTVFTFS